MKDNGCLYWVIALLLVLIVSWFFIKILNITSPVIGLLVGGSLAIILEFFVKD